jgi:hypothetical protein
MPLQAVRQHDRRSPGIDEQHWEKFWSDFFNSLPPVHERVQAARVLARFTAFASTADEYGLGMIDEALTIHQLGFGDANYPLKVSSIEAFILYLIEQYKNRGLSTPEGVEELLAKFRADFGAAVSTAQRLADRGVLLLSKAATA